MKGLKFHVLVVTLFNLNNYEFCILELKRYLYRLK